MNRISHYLTLLLCITTGVINTPFAAAANLNAADDEVVTVTTAWSVKHARPGDSIMLAMVVAIKEGYHINADPRQIKPLQDITPYHPKMTVGEATPWIVMELPR